MTEQEITEELAVCDAATPGPWEVRYGGNFSDIGAVGFIEYCNSNQDSATELKVGSTYWPWSCDESTNAKAEADAKFIALARTALPVALKELRAARNRRAILEDEAEMRKAELLNKNAELVEANRHSDELFKEIEDHAFIIAHVKRVTRHVADGAGIHLGSQFDALMDDVRALATVKIEKSPALDKLREAQRIRDAAIAANTAEFEGHKLTISDHRAELARRDAEISALRAALEPFSKVFLDRWMEGNQICIRIKDALALCRNAHAAFSPATPAEPTKEERK